MPSVTLKRDKNTAVFSWVADREDMDVAIDVEEMRNSHTGRMTKEAARLIWNMLKSKGYETCPTKM